MRRPVRTISAAVALALLVGAGLAACQTPIPTFTVTDTGNHPDLHVGDGTCADAHGRCTLQAAIDEANALGRASIVLDVHQPIDAPTTPYRVRSKVDLHPTAGTADLDSTRFVITPKGRIDAWGLEPGYEGTGLVFQVQGTLHVDRSYVTGVEVAAGGNAALVRTKVQGNADFPGRWDNHVTNDGVLLLWYSYLDATIRTNAPAKTYATASLVASNCATGSITSRGYNLGWASTCKMTNYTDRDIAKVGTGMNFLEGARDYDIEEPGPLVDRIPDGVAGCGSAAEAPSPRIVPTDDDDNGVAGCEIGPQQLS